MAELSPDGAVPPAPLADAPGLGASRGVTGETGTTLVEQLTARFAHTIVGHPATVVAAACALTLAAVVHVVLYATNPKHTFLDTDRNNLIGRELDYNKRFSELETEFGDLGAMAVVVEARTRDRCKEFADELAARCAKHSDLYGAVFSHVPLEKLKGKLLFASLGDLRELAGTLEHVRIPERLAQGEGVAGLFSGLGDHVQWKIDQGDDTSGGGGEDMGALLFSVLDGLQDAVDKGTAYRTPWKDVVDDGWAWAKPSSKPVGTRTSRYGEDGKRLTVLVQPVAHEGDLDDSAVSVHSLRALLAEMSADAKWADVNVGLTGGPVLAVDEMDTYRKDVAVSTIAGFFSVIVLFMISFRRVLGPLLAGVCLAMAIAFTLSFAALTFGHLNLISIVFLEILIGLGIDFGIHLISRYDEERTYGMESGPALEAALGLTGRASAAGATTTALAFMATLFADFQGIREFGVIAAVGILFCLATMLLVLPAMVVIADRGRGGLTRRPRPGWARTRAAVALDRWAIGKPWTLVLATLAIAATLFGLSLVGFQVPGVPWLKLERIRYSGNLLDLQATNLDSVKYAIDLVQGDEIANVVCSNTDELEKVAEKLRKLDKVVDHIESFPVQQKEKLKELGRIHHQVAAALEGPEKPCRHEPADEARARADLAALASGVGCFRTALENAQELAGNNGRKSDVAGIQQILDRLDKLVKATDPAAPEALARAKRLFDYEKELTRELSDLMKSLLAESAQSVEVTAADLPKEIHDRFVGKTGKLLVHIYPRSSIFDDKPLEQFVTALRGELPELTGVPVQIYETGKRMKEGYEKAGYFAFIFIGIYLVFHFRSFAQGTITLLALVVGSALGTGLLALKGETLNPANMLAIPLTLGIGVCYAIQLVHRHRQAYARRSVAGPQPVIATSTGRGVILSAGTNVVGFGALALAHHQGTASIGWAITFGVVGCLVAALLFLPALLRLWTGPSEPTELKGQPGPKIGPEGKVARPAEDATASTP